MFRPTRYAVAVALMLSIAAIAVAEPTLSVTPPRLALLVVPGGSETRTLMVTNETSLPVVAKISFRDRHVRSDGSVELLAPGVLDRSCAPWLDTEVRFLELAPWQKKELAVRADVPPGISGSYWCDLVLEPVGGTGAGMDAIVRIHADGAGTSRRRLTVSWSSFEREDDDRVRIKLRASNEGNTFLYGRGSLLVRGEGTPTLENIPLSILGDFEVEPAAFLDIDLITRSPVAPGRYWIGVQIDLGRSEFVQRDTTVEFTGPPKPARKKAAKRPAESPPVTEMIAAPPEIEKTAAPAKEIAANDPIPSEETVAGEVQEREQEPVAAVEAETKAEGEGIQKEVPEAIAPSTGETPAVVPAPASPEGDGKTYRIQLHATADRERAEAFVKRKADGFDRPVYVEYLAPYHKVFLGRGLTKKEALALRLKVIAAGYEGAWVAPEGLQPVPKESAASLAPPPEAPESASLAPADHGLAYRVRLFFSEDEKEAIDFQTAVETVFSHPLFVEADGEGFAVYVGRSLTGGDAWAALERAKSFGFEKARIVESSDSE